MLLQVLDYLGVAVFAVSGAIMASRKQLDFLAFIFFATITGVGGGTLRDMMLDVPVFWVRSETYLFVCVGVGVVMWFVAHIVERLGKPLRWADAIGIAAYSVMGAAKSLSVYDSVLVAVVMGVLSATFGGVIRDVLAGEPSAIIKPEIYVTPTVVGAGSYVILLTIGVGSWPAAIVAGALALVLRGGAIEFGWTLPGYKASKSAR